MQFKETLYATVQALDGWISAHDALASWVQAVGTILAIFVSFAIAQSQLRTDKRKRIEEESEKKRHAAFLCLAFSERLVDCLEKHIERLRNETEEELRVDREILHEIIRWSQQVAIDRIGDEALKALLQLQVIAAETRVQSQKLIATNIGREHWANVFEKIHARAVTWDAKLRKAIQTP
ncbi:MAG: hypothetical protein GC151_13710 [Betaproteobacteria bacterium]|nr:hypothetical protein [Betaproteobacteria bacterium]